MNADLANGEAQPARRARTLRRSLVITFTAVSLVSVLLLGLLNFYQARNLLTDSVSDQLVNQQRAKAVAIRNGIERLEQTVVVAARSREVIEGVVEFSAAFDEVGQSNSLDPGELQSVRDTYDIVVDAIANAGLDAPPPDDLIPGSDVGRYLQYHYITANTAEDRSEMADAPGDRSGYGAVHAVRHPALVQLRSQLGFDDLLLVDTAGNVVYSTDKRLDYATNMTTGPYRTTGVGNAVINGIPAVPIGEAVFVDFEIYLPAEGRPSLFIGAAIRSEARTVGSLLVEVPIETLNTLTIGEADWEATGFGDTGEVYVVGRDQLMRTDSRLWIEDPAEYQRELEKQDYDARLGDLIAIFDSTALLQPVESDAVQEALSGEQFIGRSTNYLGRKSLTSAGPVGSDLLDWVVVAEVAAAEANDPLGAYLARILITGVVLIPIVVLLALLFADRMTKPVEPVVAAAGRVADGDLSTTLPDLGRNEFGDVARRLNRLTAALREREDALAVEEQETRRLLLSALPPRLVTALRSGEQDLLDLLDTATVVVVDVDGLVGGAGISEEAGVELSTELSSRVETLADDLGVERVRSSTDQHVFAAGLATPDTAAQVAADFAVEVAALIEQFRHDHAVEVTYRAGISAGQVIAGLVTADQLTYGVFGDPPRTALALAGIAARDQILIDAVTAAELDDSWSLEPATGLSVLQGEHVSAMVLRQPAGSDSDSADSPS
ncbi:MAG: adenylate/guanylate cyclase domain-containing protein [Acidimicrobiia bacterium]|nr:adenylate/guanylate cyclase domain-containing protein [Acidimicrobiia bacterium]